MEKLALTIPASAKMAVSSDGDAENRDTFPFIEGSKNQTRIK